MQSAVLPRSKPRKLWSSQLISSQNGLYNAENLCKWEHVKMLQLGRSKIEFVHKFLQLNGRHARSKEPLNRLQDLETLLQSQRLLLQQKTLEETNFNFVEKKTRVYGCKFVNLLTAQSIMLLNQSHLLRREVSVWKQHMIQYFGIFNRRRLSQLGVAFRMCWQPTSSKSTLRLEPGSRSSLPTKKHRFTDTKLRTERTDLRNRNSPQPLLGV